MKQGREKKDLPRRPVAEKISVRAGKSKFTGGQIVYALKQMVADLSLDKCMLQEVLTKGLERSRRCECGTATSGFTCCCGGRLPAV